MSAPLEELMAALLSATDDRKAQALRVLRGETQEPERRAVSGPMLMSVGEAAKLLGVSRPTLWRILKAGRLEKVEIYAGAYRYRRADIEALAEGRGSASEQLAVGSGGSRKAAGRGRRAAVINDGGRTGMKAAAGRGE